ncbi:hypothetical protein A2833_03035 [Candidatus Azambacteria bacterium RIFCSPHIGHO2_01_FULL_44_55]|uniref:Uncharacterized protein n=1 Tax=Candidatus Azambacteria bacterium RIFCSPLOWO2_02_FULL_44_14 TaxID=1797306 RepID=A0A1F5CBG1_9BACT|nr:MAG: hypothetical protein A3A18_02350 [Candidatus Azambacteria bacterium RIFCSPLOWO2_01_FULL_44_84]OGD33067.1 MAG: hypothetical protein A3C78_01675 [Candidatus Azambacteria bacterium RIFCSPHIGHO2_02_FULL_45_18]OGD40158.1 MAG: hypothetical protein A3I30_02730 [Candidatus Azambacteria bacterium RIFCSPLOWO2_02_FULL_44_14]OGD41690.1 MAG: hypothetical protein A2833_03035 [Candidatus Azambacteria bacterium RIFCSPHIGHO2_01_FULL_44_55]
MKRKIRRFFKVILIAAAMLAVVFGIFKYLERNFIRRATERLDKNEPYAALAEFDSWQSFKIHRLALEWGLMDPLWYYHWGLAALRTGDYQKAYVQFRRVSEVSSDPVLKSLAYFNQGEARLWQWDAGAHENAASLYIDALKINPEMVIAKKRLEWLRQANLVKTKAEMKARGDKGRPNQDSKNQDDKDGQSEKFKSTQGKQRRGY